MQYLIGFKRMKDKTSLVLLIFIVFLSLASSKRYFQVKNSRIYDQQGGQRIFHGLNVIFEAQLNYEEDFKKMKALGINAVRVSPYWKDYEPKQGQFDEKFLKSFVNFVNLAGKYGISSLVEFHQDIFSIRFCGYGMPLWLVGKEIYQSFAKPLTSEPVVYDPVTGKPNNGICQKYVFELYGTRAVSEAFQSLWTNKNGMLDKFINYWKRIVSAFKDNPNVLAYQLFNEPWPGSEFQHPLILIPPNTERKHLQGVYDKISLEMRKVDPDLNIGFEPVTWLEGLNSGFTSAPGGSQYSSSSIFCFHYYKPPIVVFNQFFAARHRDITRLKVGGFLTQFYALQNEIKPDEFLQIMKKTDELFISWFGWHWPNQGENHFLMYEIKRTYNQRVAGSIQAQQYDNTSKLFTLTYKADRNAGNTIIWFNSKQVFPNGADIKIAVGTQTGFKSEIKDTNYIYIDSSQFTSDATVKVEVRPKVAAEGSVSAARKRSSGARENENIEQESESWSQSESESGRQL